MKLNIIKEQCNFKNDVVAVALSGGRDSIALLHFLFNNKKELGIKEVIAFHINHSIREEAKDDEKFCINFTKKLGVKLFRFKTNIPAVSKELNMGEEEAGRFVRQKIYKSLVDSKVCTYVATAHHMSDQAETVLMNILRGSGLKGATGMKCKDGYLVKPLLHTSSKEIDKYIKENKLKFVVDKTNFDKDYTRNFLRHEGIKTLNKKFDVESAIDNFSSSTQVDEDFIESKVNYKKVKSNKDGVKILKKDLLVHEAIASRLIIFALKKLCPIDYSYNDVKRVLALLNAQNGKKETLNNNIIAINEFEYITFKKQEEKSKKEVPFKVGTIKFLDSSVIVKKATRKEFENRKKGELFADLDKLMGSTIRTRRDSDKIKTFGGTKLVSDFLLERRVPLSKRDELPLIVKDNKVLFIVSVETSLNAIIDETTRHIVKISIK